jgi:hypothetical protein
MTLCVRGQRFADFLEEGSVPELVDQSEPDHGDAFPVAPTTDQLRELATREAADDVSQEDGLLLWAQVQGLQQGHKLLA